MSDDDDENTDNKENTDERISKNSAILLAKQEVCYII